MSALLELAARVEAATGPERELDALIGCAVKWRWDGWVEGDLEVEASLTRFGETYVLDRVAHSHNSVWKLLPAYTASLDAAMSLVPEGWAIEHFAIWPGIKPMLDLLSTHEGKDGSRWHGGQDRAPSRRGGNSRPRSNRRRSPCQSHHPRRWVVSGGGGLRSLESAMWLLDAAERMRGPYTEIILRPEQLGNILFEPMYRGALPRTRRASKPKPRPIGPTNKRAKVKAARKAAKRNCR